MKAAVLALALLLSGCGGGSGSTSAPAAPSTPPAQRHDLLYGYFGTAAGQIAATAAYVNLLHAVDWGDWDTEREDIKARIIAQMQEGRARGLTQVILSTGFLTFDARYRYLGPAALTAFKAQLDALDLSRMVVALYPIDEPDVHGISDATMQQAVNDTRAAWPAVKIAVVYGMHGTPGISAYDWIGHDDYGAGAGVLNELPQIRADQQWIIVPGGADPWKQDPSPFADFANGQRQVALIWAFIWTDFTDPDGHPQAGINRNGMAPAYAGLGAQIKGS